MNRPMDMRYVHTHSKGFCCYQNVKLATAELLVDFLSRPCIESSMEVFCFSKTLISDTGGQLLRMIASRNEDEHSTVLPCDFQILGCPLAYFSDLSKTSFDWPILSRAHRNIAGDLTWLDGNMVA